MTSVEATPAVAQQVFGSNTARAERYAELLVTTGVERGLIGPREPERIWSRHILNCAAPVELLPDDERVVDVGSGAGLPGIPLALARANLQVDLVEPLARRAAFLGEVIDELGLSGRVRIVRGRAEDRQTRDMVGGVGWVTSRAVAPLDRLVAWCLPLLSNNGRVVALKGSRAEAEISDHANALRSLGASTVTVVRCGIGIVDPPTTVVVVERDRDARPGMHSSRSPSARRSKGKT